MQNEGISRQKIFKKKANPRSSQLLPFYIIDLFCKMQANDEAPITIKKLQKKLIDDKKGYHDLRQLYYVLNNMHLYFETLRIGFINCRSGDTKAKAFFLITNLKNLYEPQKLV